MSVPCITPGECNISVLIIFSIDWFYVKIIIKKKKKKQIYYRKTHLKFL